MPEGAGREGEFKDNFCIFDMNDHVDDDDVIYCTEEHQGGELEVKIRMLLARESPELIYFILHKNVLRDITKEYIPGQDPGTALSGSKLTSLLSS